MSDLSDRLRRFNTAQWPLLTEAAYEIERLREQVSAYKAGFDLKSAEAAKLREQLEKAKPSVDEMDKVLTAYGVAVTETEVDRERRWEAITARKFKEMLDGQA